MRTIKRTQLLLSTFLIMFMLMTTSVLAYSTLLTYQGWGIRGWWSINSFTLDSSKYVTLHHTNSSFQYLGVGEDIMKVTFEQQGMLGWYFATNYSINTSGNGTSVYHATLPSGTYKLYFNTLYQGAVADISGNVTG